MHPPRALVVLLSFGNIELGIWCLLLCMLCYATWFGCTCTVHANESKLCAARERYDDAQVYAFSRALNPHQHEAAACARTVSALTTIEHTNNTHNYTIQNVVHNDIEQQFCACPYGQIYLHTYPNHS